MIYDREEQIDGIYATYKKARTQKILIEQQERPVSNEVKRHRAFLEGRRKERDSKDFQIECVRKTMKRR